ncbi:MAG: tetratricopeptide repeat protein [Proteobacteria bacterium]|nr:tetratricopeptide repeat protein [Pseudomonadota bacterium]
MKTPKTKHKKIEREITGSNRSRNLLICLFIIIATLAVYWQVRDHEFISLDDPTYITENSQIKDGFTKDGIIWAFTTTYASNWHPLTWRSHMLDVTLFGMDAGWHHLTNLFLHIVNSILLFLILFRMTGALWQSALAAALFALHPLHVESVAWASERKDVLSTFFWLLTMGAYMRYAKRPAGKRYLLILIFFVLGLMAKPMLVTLPFVLLLMDYWPLGRIKKVSGIRGQGSGIPPDMRTAKVTRLLLEKAPLFMLAAASCIVTFVAQQKGGAVSSLELLSLKVRIANAVVSYSGYLVKMIWPHNLAIYYPHPGALPMWQVAGSGLLLICLSLVMLRATRKYPYLATGWLWYLGTLVPVIGLVQVGQQAMADRYTYVPLIGLFILIAWGIPDLIGRWRYKKIILTISGIAVIVIFAAATWSQLGYWKNSVTLFERTVNVTTNNFLALNNLGNALAKEGKVKEAIQHYIESIRINPNFTKAHNNFGLVLAKQGNLNEAIRHFSEALRIKPDYAKAHNNLGAALARKGNLKGAVQHYKEAIRIEPDYAKAHYSLGVILKHEGRFNEAIKHLSETLRIDPDFSPLVYYKIAALYARQNKKEESIAWLRKAVEKGYKNWNYLRNDKDLENIRGSLYYKKLIGEIAKRGKSN